MNDFEILKRYGWTDALIAEFQKSLDLNMMGPFGNPRGTAVVGLDAASLFVPVTGPSSNAGSAVFVSEAGAGRLEAK